MLTDDLWASISELAAFLHPDPATAGTITVAAADPLVLLHRLRAFPPRRVWRLPEAQWPQYCVSLASDGSERAHERPGRAPQKRPTRDDYLVRYVKCLIWWTLDRPACHVAVAPDGAEHLAVTLEGGQTVALTIEWGRTPRGRRPAYIIQLTYTDPPAAETPEPAGDRMPAPIVALGAEVERVQSLAVQFCTDVERLQTHARALLANVEWLQGQALALHRDEVHLQAIRAQVKDMLQQLSAETP